MGWQDISGEVFDLDGQQHVQITTFETRLNTYTTDKSLKTVKDLMVSVEEQLVHLRHQRSRLLQLERHYTQEALEKERENSSGFLVQFFYASGRKPPLFFRFYTKSASHSISKICRTISTTNNKSIGFQRKNYIKKCDSYQ